MLASVAPDAQELDAASDRIVASCLQRGNVEDAECIAQAKSVEQLYGCSPTWAIPWSGVESCDALLHDAMCMFQEVDRGNWKLLEEFLGMMQPLQGAAADDKMRRQLTEMCATVQLEFLNSPEAANCLKGRASVLGPEGDAEVAGPSESTGMP